MTRYDFTVIQAQGERRLCKVYTPESTQAYDRVYEVRAEVWTAFDLTDLHDILAILEGRRDMCILRGVPLFGDDVWTPRRMRSETGASAKDGIPPSFAPGDNAWICIDLDDVARPEGWRDHQPLRMVDALVPPAFRGAGLVWQWSNGARPGKAIRAHVWYLTDRAVCDKSLRDWLKGEGVEDRSLYNAVQLHYTAAPVFKGLADPLDGCRLLMRDGDPVTLPPCVVDLEGYATVEAAALAERTRKQQVERLTFSLIESVGKQARYSQGALRSAEKKIMNAGIGGRHGAIVSEATSLWGLVLSGIIEESVWEDTIRGAAAAALPPERIKSGEVDDALEWARTHGEERTI